MAIVLDGVGTVNGVSLPTTGFGKVLQVVRATDATQRTTTSTSYVDASISVTITPQKNTSNILLISNFFTYVAGTTNAGEYQITDSANTAISGAQLGQLNKGAGSSTLTLIAYASPATLSATTYKLRFRTNGGGTNQLENASSTGQMYAIEVSA